MSRSVHMERSEAPVGGGKGTLSEKDMLPAPLRGESIVTGYYKIKNQ